MRMKYAEVHDFKDKMREAKRIFDRIADSSESDGAMSKAELVKAHGGDFNLFNKLDVDDSGVVLTRTRTRT